MNSIKKYLNGFLVLAGFVMAGSAKADLLHCGVHSVKSIYIQGERDDNSPYANKILAQLDGQPCNGKSLVYIENNNPNAKAILSGLMAAYTGGTRVGIYVNTSKTIANDSATQIAIVELTK